MLQHTMTLQRPPVAIMPMSGGKLSFGCARVAVCIDTACVKFWYVSTGPPWTRCGGR